MYFISCLPFLNSKQKKINKVHKSTFISFSFRKVILDCEALRLFHSYVLWEVYWWIFPPSGQQNTENCWFTCFSCERIEMNGEVSMLLCTFNAFRVCYCFSFITLQSKQLFWAFFYSVLMWSRYYFPACKGI